MHVIEIRENEAGQRLDKFLGKYLDRAPKGFYYKMLRKKNIILNGKRADGKEKLKTGDQITCFLAEETIEKFRSSRTEIIKMGDGTFKLSVLFEDKNVLIINKPAGILSQKARASDVSMVEYIIAYLLDKGELTREDLRTFRPSVCNRLDRNTSGILVAGKSLSGLQTLSAMLKDRSLHKYYQCVVLGTCKKKEYIRGYLKKEERTNRVRILKEKEEGAVEIETEYEALEYGNGFTLLQVKLITGRSHQIRAHLSSIGHPILGDFKYGNRELNEECRKKWQVKSQLLHASKLEMPVMKGDCENLSEMVFIAPLPSVFYKVMEKGI